MREKQTPELDKFFERQGVGRFRQWFRDAVDSARLWQDEAIEDYDFVEGRQWTKAELQRFKEVRRPAITINRIRPLMNLLSGYQRINRFDIEFAPRTEDDTDICQVRKGVTKYILDRCDYTTHESATFMDAAIGGLGWFFVGYRIDEESEDGEGEAYVRREDPFSIYPDPESHNADFSDAKYIFRAKWTDKDELKEVYPEHADAIDAQFAIYDAAERENASRRDELLWYKRELQKVRLVECWYKKRETKTTFLLATGEEIPAEEVTPDLFLSGLIVAPKITNLPVVKVCVFFDNVVLEDMDSPYQHGEFPLVPLTCYYYGIGGDEIPAGFVRDLKNPQREINKRRIQQLDILNKIGNGGGWIEDDAMTEKQFAEFEKHGSIPGHFQRVRPMTLNQGKIQERPIGQYPAGVAQAEAQATNDLTAISGINEALMGVDIPSGSSGRAIELKQKQSITHLAVIFDNLRTAKKKMAYLLWGRRGHAGIIPQFYTAEKVYRVEGVNGQQFITVNQQVVEQDPIAGTIVHTLNDLSQGEFDIVIADVEASTTQRQAQMLTLVDAVSRLGVPGDLVFDIILDLSDVPHKEEIKQRWQQRQESQAKAAQDEMQMKLQLEEIRNQDSRQVINFRDAPPPIQLAMAAKAGYIDSGIVERVLQNWIQATFPQEAAEQQAEAQAQAEMQAQMQEAGVSPEMQGQSPENLDQMIAFANMMGGQGQAQPQQGRPMTQAATESLMRGMTPAI